MAPLSAHELGDLIHDARNSLAAARARVELQRRRIRRRRHDAPERLDAGLTSALESLDDVARILARIDDTLTHTPTDDGIVAVDFKPVDEGELEPPPPWRPRPRRAPTADDADERRNGDNGHDD